MNDTEYIKFNFSLQTKIIKIKSNQNLKFGITYKINVKFIAINNNENMTD